MLQSPVIKLKGFSPETPEPRYDIHILCVIAQCFLLLRLTYHSSLLDKGKEVEIPLVDLIDHDVFYTYVPPPKHITFSKQENKFRSPIREKFV